MNLRTTAALTACDAGPADTGAAARKFEARKPRQIGNGE